MLLKSYDDYYNGYVEDDGKLHKGYKDLVEEIESKFPIGTQITGEESEKEFISLYGSLLRVTNILNAFDKFESQRMLSDRDVQDYQSMYIDLYDKWRPKGKQKEDISDDLVFEMELVKQVEVNIDYILTQVAKYHDDNSLDAEAVARIMKAVDSSTQLRSKKELIEAFLQIVNVDTNVHEDWHTFVDVEMEADIQKIIDEEKLKPEQTRAYIAKSFDFGSLKTNGTVIDDIMPPVSRFGGGRAKKKTGVIEKLKGFFEKYIGLI